METREARAFWVTAPEHGEIRTETLRAPLADEAVVRALYSGISRGTESLVFRGRVPKSEWTRMRAPFQAGDFPAPVKYGYASVGRVEQGPGGLQDQLQDRHVFVLFPHQSRYVVPAAALHPIPEDVPPGRAVLAANMETAINGVWDATLQEGDRVTVIGAGTVGALVAWVASQEAGCDVELVDINPRRASLAHALGVRFAEPASATRNSGVVIHTSGSPKGLELSLDIAGFEARIIEMSWYGDQPVTLPLGAAFHSRRLSIISSQVGHIAPSHRMEWDTKRRMNYALSLLSDPSLDALITGESDFDSLPRVMSELSTAPGDTLCHRIRY